MIPYIDGWLGNVEHPTDEQLWEAFDERPNYNPYLPIQFKGSSTPNLSLYIDWETNSIKIEFEEEIDNKFINYFSFTGEKTKEVFSIEDPGGGENFKMYAHFFISKKEAFEVVKDFIQTGKRSGKIQWKKTEFGDAPYDTKYVVNKYYDNEEFYDNADELDLEAIQKLILTGDFYQIDFNTKTFWSSIQLHYLDKWDKYRIEWYGTWGVDDFYAYDNIRENIILDKSKGDDNDDLLKDFYIGKTQAVEVLFDFIENGQRTEKVKWLSKKDERYPTNRKFIIESENFAQYCSDESDMDLSMIRQIILSEQNLLISIQSEWERRLELFATSLNGYLMAYSTTHIPSDDLRYRRQYFYAFNPVGATVILSEDVGKLREEVEKLGLRLAVPSFYDNMLISNENVLNTVLFFIKNNDVPDTFDWFEKNETTFPKDSTLANMRGFFTDDLPF